MAKGIMLTPEQILGRRHVIKKMALELFKEKGFERTSMREIAESMDMGKSSLYDFFTSKAGIMVFAYEEEMKAAVSVTKRIIDLQPSPAPCLLAIMRNNLNFTRNNKYLTAWLNTEAVYLDEAYQQRIFSARYAYQDIVQSVIEEGIKDKHFRMTDPALATRLLINSMLSIAYTSRPSGSEEEMLEEAVNIFLHGITKTDS